MCYSASTVWASGRRALRAARRIAVLILVVHDERPLKILYTFPYRDSTEHTGLPWHLLDLNTTLRAVSPMQVTPDWNQPRALEVMEINPTRGSQDMLQW